MLARIFMLMVVMSSQTMAANRVADMYAKQVDLVEHDLPSLARGMPAGRYDFRPLTEENQLDPLTTYFGSQPRVEVAAGVAHHSDNHDGQMVVNARMNGIVPPSSQR